MLESWPCVELITYSYKIYDVTRLRRWNKFRGLRVDCFSTSTYTLPICTGQKPISLYFNDNFCVLHFKALRSNLKKSSGIATFS